MKLIGFLLLTLAGVASLAHGAAAPGAGTVSGHLKASGKSIPLKLAYAHLHDNAEGILSSPKELRIALVDREIPADALNGTVFLAVQQLALSGDVRGALITLNPDSPNVAFVTLLDKPAEAGASLMTQSMSSSGEDLWKKFEFGATQVAGSIERKSDGGEFSMALDYALQFKAPVTNEPPVTADLKGKDAQASPQVALLRKKAQAMAAGDIAGMKKLTSARAVQLNEARMAESGMSDADMKKMMKQFGPEALKSAAAVKRVVVRGDHAVALSKSKTGEQWLRFVLEGGEWKSDD